MEREIELPTGPLGLTFEVGTTRVGSVFETCTIRNQINAGETVVAQDGEPGRVFFVTSGTADARVAVPELARPLLVGTFARGDAFGHLEFFLEEERDHSGDVSGLDDDADLRETCAVANRASVVASTRLRGVAVDGVAFRAIAPPGTALRRALDAERATFANGVA